MTDSTNFLCSQLMTAKVGNVEYDDRAALYVGAFYPEPEGKGEDDIYRTELLIAQPESLMVQDGANIDGAGQTGAPKYTEKEIEAVMVAERIRQLVGSFPVTDAATGETRTAKYSDIVLLFRATAGWDEDFRRILSERGSRCMSPAGRGILRRWRSRGSSISCVCSTIRCRTSRSLAC